LAADHEARAISDVRHWDRALTPRPPARGREQQHRSRTPAQRREPAAAGAVEPAVEPGAEAPAKLRTSACGLATGSTVCRCSCRLRGDCDRRWRLAAGYVLERFGDELCVGVYVILAYLAPTD